MSETQKIEELWHSAEDAAALGDIRKVVSVLEHLSNIGCVEALSAIGTIYEAGGGNVDKDAEQAVKWFQKALEFSEDPVAHVGLGRAYYYSLGGLRKDYERALFHFNRAFETDLPEAALYMGILAYEGVAIEKNTLKAKKYFKQSASHGYCLSYVYLARLAFFNKQFIKALFSFFRAYLMAWNIGRKDPSDRRLIGM